MSQPLEAAMSDGDHHQSDDQSIRPARHHGEEPSPSTAGRGRGQSPAEADATEGDGVPAGAVTPADSDVAPRGSVVALTMRSNDASHGFILAGFFAFVAVWFASGVLGSVLLVVATVRLARARLTVTALGMVARNVLGKRVLLWSQIDRIEDSSASSYDQGDYELISLDLLSG